MKNLLMMCGLFVVFLAGAAASVTACGDDDPPNDAMARPDAGVRVACDPALSTPRGMLLNAPLDPSVQVISKTPAHPGDPGPDGLP